MDKLIAGTVNIGVASGKMVSRLSSSELLNINALITEYEGLVGEGSESSPYLIESALDLIYFNQKAHNNENIIGLTPQRELNDIDLPALTSVYKITKNIVLNDPLETSLYEAGTDYYNWLGIGTSDNPFTGKITGDNNISISGIKAVTTGDYSGFINYATDLVMSNIEIKDSYFKSAYNAGAFVGYLSTSQNGSASFTNCINSAEVNGRIYSGGMVGKYNNSSYGPNLSFINCTNNGHIISNSYAGGLIGGSGINNSNSGTITF